MGRATARSAGYAINIDLVTPELAAQRSRKFDTAFGSALVLIYLTMIG